METLAKTKENNQRGGLGDGAPQRLRLLAENKPYFSIEMALRVPQNDIIFWKIINPKCFPSKSIKPQGVPPRPPGFCRYERQPYE